MKRDADRPLRWPRTAKKAVYDRIVELSLDPLDFEWREYEAGNQRVGEELFHKPTQSFFTISPTMSMYESPIVCDWDPAFSDGANNAYVSSMTDAGHHILAWLALVAEEHQTPDVWGSLREDRDAIAGEVVDGDRLFTEPEQQAIIQRLAVLENQIKQLGSPTAEQATRLERAIEDLAKATKDSTRGQWRTQFAGVVFQTILDLSLDPTRAQQVIHAATVLLAPVFSHIKQLLL